MNPNHIYYTLTDEAPALATRSLLPVLQGFAGAAQVHIEARDISLAARILAAFPEYLEPAQRVPDELAFLGDLALKPEANIVKLPNISASLPQLKAAIAELQGAGYALPDYPAAPTTEEEKAIARRYAQVKGSAVNPVLREGNSDRRAPAAVKEFVRKNPHRMEGWSTDSQTHVASMTEGDFYETEQCWVAPKADELKIIFINAAGQEKALRKPLPVAAQEVIDAALMRKEALQSFFRHQRDDAARSGLLYSLHLKATMMKVSDPIIFGHAITTFLEAFFARHGERLREAGYVPNDGLAALERLLEHLPQGEAESLKADYKAALAEAPDLMMVNSRKGTTNLHVPSDVIIDASMPAMIRNGGQLWDKSDQTRDVKAVIPDRSYAGIYDEIICFCQKNGAFDPTTMGSVPNVGLMAQKAEEYGSHDKTFEMPEAGQVEVRTQAGEVVLTQAVEPGDIFRMCQTKTEAIENWVQLAVRRSRLSGTPAIFWLDEQRAHDRVMRSAVTRYLKQERTDGLTIEMMNPREAMQYTLQRLVQGEDTISVTGNVLRDYLTDLFPILEVGTSAKMLSIVPLMKGGGLFETGAGGSAPKHVQQMLAENHLRWDSLGEFLAVAASLEHLGQQGSNATAACLAQTLNQATALLLENRKGPSRKVHEIDNRGSHFYLALYWAQALASQEEQRDLQDFFAPVAQRLQDAEKRIQEELLAVQGQPVDLGGYYYPHEDKVRAAMRPCATFNAIIDDLRKR